MIEDMTARRFKQKVHKDYVLHVRTFAAFSLADRATRATSEVLRRFQLHMAPADQTQGPSTPPSTRSASFSM